MIKVVRPIAFVLIQCTLSTADIVISIDFYEASTTTPITQPILVGETFEMAVSLQDTVGDGVSAALLDWFFDNDLLEQGTGFQLGSGWNDLGGSMTNADGGTVEAFNFNPPTPADDAVEIARIDYLATAAGDALFSTAGTGNPMAATFVTFDGRGFNPDGSCNPSSNPPCDGEMVQFGTGQVTIVAAPSSGDFNDDGIYDCADINALVAEIAAGSNNSEFDLTDDGAVNGDDLDAWLVEGGANNPTATGGNAFLRGDANLDGVVDGLDFITWNEHKFTATAAWCSGDFNAEGIVDGQDFIIWNDNKFMSSDHVGTVPEPGSLVTLLFGVTLWVARRR